MSQETIQPPATEEAPVEEAIDITDVTLSDQEVNGFVSDDLQIPESDEPGADDVQDVTQTEPDSSPDDPSSTEADPWTSIEGLSDEDRALLSKSYPEGPNASLPQILADAARDRRNIGRIGRENGDLTKRIEALENRASQDPETEDRLEELQEHYTTELERQFPNWTERQIQRQAKKHARSQLQREVEQREQDGSREVSNELTQLRAGYRKYLGENGEMGALNFPVRDLVEWIEDSQIAGQIVHSDTFTPMIDKFGLSAVRAAITTPEDMLKLYAQHVQTVTPSNAETVDLNGAANAASKAMASRVKGVKTSSPASPAKPRHPGANGIPPVDNRPIEPYIIAEWRNSWVDYQDDYPDAGPDRIPADFVRLLRDTADA